MPRPYRPYISQTIGELNEELGWMLLSSLTFVDKQGYYIDQNIDTVFKGFNASLDNLRPKLGEERYARMPEMSDWMRALFEADPETKTGDTLAGCKIIHEMELMLRHKRAAPKSEPPAV